MPKKRLKTTKAERREANELNRRARLRAKWRTKKAAQRAAKAPSVARRLTPEPRRPLCKTQPNSVPMG